MNGYGSCNGGISREHYISESVLRAMGANPTITIGGLAWQPKNTLQNIGISSLQSKILCKHHNAGLSNLDSAAASLFKTLHAIDKNRDSITLHTKFDGLKIEKWLLKVLFGISASGGFDSKNPPEYWKALLTGTSWQTSSGMYVYPPNEIALFSSDLFIETKINPETKEILAASFTIAGVIFNLVLGRPEPSNTFGVYRPRGLIFQHSQVEYRVEFQWPLDTNEAVIYKNVGSTTSKPTYHEGWKEQ